MTAASFSLLTMTGKSPSSLIRDGGEGISARRLKRNERRGSENDLMHIDHFVVFSLA